MLKQIILLCAIVMLSFVCIRQAQAQSLDRKFEAGGQFSLLQIRPQNNGCLFNRDISDLCFEAFSKKRNSEPGFGGRIGYNISRYFALEAEANFFPRDRPSIGKMVQGLFGAKVGKRFENFGLFAKARPGFIRFSKGDTKQVGSSVDFPSFSTVAKTNLAFDIGGVAEWYPSRNLIVRFDGGDTLIRFGKRNVVGVDLGGSGLPSLATTAVETTHNFQGSVGVGYRF